MSATGEFRESRWDLAFVGLLFFQVIQYFRPQEKYDLLANLQLGKVAFAITVFGLILARRLHKYPPGKTLLLDISVAGFLLAGFLSSLFAYYPPLAWKSYAALAELVVIYFLTSRIAATEWRLRLFLFFTLLMTFHMSQFVVRTYLSDWSGEGYLEVGAGNLAFFGDSVDFGVFMCMIWPIAMWMALAEKNKITRLILFGITGVSIGALLLCGSRGAAVGAAGACVILLLNPKRVAIAFVALVILGSSYFVLPAVTKQRFESAINWKQDATASHRIYLWWSGVQLYFQNPILGVGPANFAIMAPSVPHPDNPRPHKRYVSHSTYIDVLSELGSLGAILYGSMSLLCFWVNRKTRELVKQHFPDEMKGFSAQLSHGLDLGLLGFLFSSAFASTFYYPHIWFLVGTCVANYRSVSGRIPVDLRAPARWARAGQPAPEPARAHGPRAPKGPGAQHPVPAGFQPVTGRTMQRDRLSVGTRPT